MTNELTPVSEASDETVIAHTLVSQYNIVGQTTQTLVRETIKFGAMLVEAERILDAQGALKNRKCGQGMQGWLAENCPDVNYKTAMRWKGLAVDAVKKLACGEDIALKLLQDERCDDAPAKAIALCEKMFEQKSLRQLTQQMFDFASETGTVGRPAGTADGQRERISMMQSAAILWARPMSMFSKSREAFYNAAKLLPIDDARKSLLELKDLCKALELRIKEAR